VETDQGEGFLKALGNPAGPHVLACELVGIELARRLGLRTFDFSIIHVTSDDEIPLTPGQHAAPGPGFITRAEVGHSWGGGERDLALIDNPEGIASLVVFDTWARNCDRHHPDQTQRRPNPDNVFLSEEGASPGHFLLTAIDHGHILACGRELDATLANIDVVRDQNLYGIFPPFWAYLTKERVGVALEAMRAVTRGDVRGIVATIPQEWEVGDLARQAIVNCLMDRAAFLAEHMTGLLWPQQDLPL